MTDDEEDAKDRRDRGGFACAVAPHRTAPHRIFG